MESLNERVTNNLGNRTKRRKNKSSDGDGQSMRSLTHTNHFCVPAQSEVSVFLGLWFSHSKMLLSTGRPSTLRTLLSMLGSSVLRTLCMLIFRRWLSRGSGHCLCAWGLVLTAVLLIQALSSNSRSLPESVREKSSESVSLARRAVDVAAAGNATEKHEPHEPVRPCRTRMNKRKRQQLPSARVSL